MTDRIPAAEQKRAIATVTECHIQLWRAREEARRVDEMLCRAIRGVEDAEHALDDAARRLDRMDASTTSVTSDDPSRHLILLR